MKNKYKNTFILAKYEILSCITNNNYEMHMLINQKNIKEHEGIINLMFELLEPITINSEYKFELN